MKLVITRRAQTRIAASREYLENNFYPEYGRWFEDKIISTIDGLGNNRNNFCFVGSQPRAERKQSRGCTTTI